MEFLLLDLTSVVLFSVKWIIYVLAFLLLLLGLDDLFIDLSYWIRRFYRKLFVYSNFPQANENILFTVPEKPLAVMIPAWNEVGVIGKMAELAARTLDYENYQIFVGVYPNDPDTQRDVDEVRHRFTNVHKIVCARPGPTSKADCLNNIIDAIFQFERSSGVEFAGFILHDSEDVISPLELRLFNYLLPRKDLIQVPVYPFLPHWYEFTGGHYVDEFSEQHGKDIVVREALVGQVPSAGVGTCFSRRAVMALLDDGDGIAFDVQSLTEDYDIGYRLKLKGMEEIFARFYVDDSRYATLRESHRGVSHRTSGVICVREYFPRSFHHAVRQKSRWITGIVFQGTKNLGWSSSLLQNYFLWRDRRGGFTNLVGLLVNITILIALLLYLINWLFPSSWQFPSLLEGDPVFQAVLLLNVVLLANRVFQRAFFVACYYGFFQGLLSVPRTVWSNIINFCATWRAMVNVFRAGDSRRVAWDKTQHEIPSLGDVSRVPLGHYLREADAVSEQQLEEALLAPHRLKLGRFLLTRGQVTPQQLGMALAQQNGFSYRDHHPLSFDPALIEEFPRKLALRYGVLPLSSDGQTMELAVEKFLSPVAQGAIARQVSRRVEPVMLPSGFVTLALRYWYGNPDVRKSDPVLTSLEGHPADIELVTELARYQVLLGDLIQEMGMISPQLFAQALFDFNPLKMSIGRFMVERGLISQELLEQAISLQRDLQQQAHDLAVEYNQKEVSS